MSDATRTTPSARDRHLFAPGRKRILALDGGGVRGVVALAFLKEIERALAAQAGRPVRLCDHFDLIGGTSTGAIIAAGLALSAGPGLSAALNGVRNQLDVVRQAARSARIGLALRRLRRALDDAPPNAALARSAARRAAEIMLDDVSAWDRAMEIV